MKNVIINNHSFKIKISSAEIQKAVTDIAGAINHNLKDKNPLFLAVLNGSFMFAADLMRQITIDCEISFVKLASYEGTTSSGKIKQLIGIDENVKGRTVVIIEDIVDTGNTIENIWEQLKGLGPAEIKIATLLFKSDAFIKTVPVEYAAIIVPNDFLVGYGMDYNGLGRNLNDIYVLDYVTDDKNK
ncbi:MAG: hypoxanthine phosphoribosyltransferase [Bacteroidetes bacterium]|nr:hypoxanthine phosphoribosyltransferase [Bacteroidota bacterium]